MDRDSVIEDDEIIGQSSPLQAYYNYIMSLMGLGIIAFPYVTYLVGWLWSICLMIPIVFSCYKSTRLLIEVADDLKVEGVLYKDVVRIGLGWYWPQIIDIVVIVEQLGTCIAYVIFLTYSMQAGFNAINIYVEKWKIFSMCLVISSPLLLIRKIHFFHQISQLGFYLSMIGVFIVLYECLFQIQDGNYDFSKVATYDSIQFFIFIDTFLYLGVAILLFETGPTILPIRDSMLNKDKFYKVADLSLLTAFILSGILAIICTITIREDLDQIVLFNIRNDWLQGISLITYSLALLLTYPVQLFPAIQIIEQYFYNITASELMSQEEHYDDLNYLFVKESTQLYIRIACMLSINFIAYWVPSFMHFLNLLGSVCATSLQFVVPVLIHLLHFRKKSTNLPIYSYIIILSLAVIAMIFGTEESIRGLI